MDVNELRDTLNVLRIKVANQADKEDVGADIANAAAAAITLVGEAAIALVRIADALERQNELTMQMLEVHTR